MSMVRTTAVPARRRHVHSHAPAIADIQRFFGVTGPTAQNMIVRLTDLGHITRIPGAPRSIELQVPPECPPVLRP